MFSLIIGFLFLGLTYGKPFGFGNETVCAGYKACPTIYDDKLNIHMIPHSHDDTGWTKTLDQYYYKYVQSVIGSVVLALKQNPKRRFIQVETAYFKLWWQDQTNAVKKDVIHLINEGRLEIVGAAWSMNDEATTHYQSTIDQFTLGLKYVEENLGKCARPKTGWQIDPFGHSRETASLFTQMGFDSVHFARIDFRDKSKRAKEKRMEMLWQGSDSLGKDSNIFANVFKTHYHDPDGFCFDVRCKDAPIVTDKDSPEYNWDKRVNEFIKVAQGFANIYDNNQVLLTFGADMRWEGAMKNYVNLDKLVEGVKKFKPKINGKEVNLIYSTPTCYTKAVNDYVKKNNKILDHKTDDFFPHVDSPHSIWAGYFTSRPTSKRYERSSNNLLQVSKQLKALADLPAGTTTKLEEALGVMQHHDAITGTEKTAVEKDYHRAIHKGVDLALASDNLGLSKLLGSSSDLNLKSCDLLNISICAESDKNEFNVVLWNPLSRPVSHYVQIPVNNGQWQVTDPAGKVLENHVTDNVHDFSYAAKALKAHYLEKTLFFKANLPALGYKTYHFKKTGSKAPELQIKDVKAIDKMGFLSNYVKFDKVTGLIKSITLANVSVDVKQQLMYYKSQDGNSGAYLFRTKDGQKDAQPFSDKVDSVVKVNQGELIREVRQTWKNWATQIVRIYKEENFIELDWIIGPIDVSDNVGKEIISRFSTSLKTNGEFLTDANGREMIKRKRNHRSTFDYTNEEPQAGNYYPVTSKISIKDSTKQFSVLNDRAQGGSSLKDGEVEVMLHRAMLKDDGKGVGENLNEKEFDQGLVARGSLFVTVGEANKGNGKKSMNAIERDIAQRKQLSPWIFFTSKDIPKKSQSFLKKNFPENVHLLTLDKWNDQNEILIRLEHFIPLHEDPDLSKEVTVDLTDAFTVFKIQSMEEYTLTGNTPLKELSRLDWPQLKSTLSESSPLRLEVRRARKAADLKIKLAPMQIRTFRAKIVRK